MQYLKLALVIIFVFNCFLELLACKGCLPLDEYNFDKIIPRFKAALVKFDIAYPYGDKHEAFGKLSEEIAQNQDIIFVTVGVKDYGEKENEELAQKYGVKGKDDFPAVMLFVQGKKEPVRFAETTEFTQDNLRNFIRDNTDIYIGLPGCLEEYDKIAIKFASANNREKHLKEAEKLTEKLEKEEEKNIAQTYIKFMKKILENGIGFVKQEVSRLSKIVTEGKVNDKKKKELSNRLNILHSFSIKKDEL